MPNLKSKLLSVFLILSLLLPNLPVVVFAAEPTPYEVLQTGITNATGNTATITLSDNITGDNKGTTTLTIPGSTNITLDLGAYNLTIEVSEGNGILIGSNATLTITGTSGTLTVTGGTGGAGINTTNGTLIIQGGTVKATGGAGGAGIGGGTGGAGGNITISGGTVTAIGGIGFANAIYACGGGAGIGGGGGMYNNGSTAISSGGSGNITIYDPAIVTATGGAGASYAPPPPSPPSPLLRTGSVSGYDGAGIGTGGAAQDGGLGDLGTISIDPAATVNATGGGLLNSGADIGTGGNQYGSGQDYRRPDVTFSPHPSVINLNAPTDLVFKADNPVELSSLTFNRLSPGEAQGLTQYWLYLEGTGNVGEILKYNASTGTLTIPGWAFGSMGHSGPSGSSKPFESKTYWARIFFTDAESNEFYYDVSFSLTNDPIPPSPSPPSPSPSPTATTYSLIVNGGTGSGSYAQGNVVTIVANSPEPGKVFDKWTGGNGGVLWDVNNPITTFTMPGNNAVVTATYKDDLPSTHQLIVENGSGSGYYREGEQVTIVANPATGDMLFDKWVGGNGGIIGYPHSTATTFIMPGNSAFVTATYRYIIEPTPVPEPIEIPPAPSYIPPSVINGNIVCNTHDVPYSATSTNISSTISSQILRNIVNKAFIGEEGGKTIKIDYRGIHTPGDPTSITLTIDMSDIMSFENVTFIIETDFGVFIFSIDQLIEWFGDGELGVYTITFEKSSLIFDIEKDGKSASWSYLTPMAKIGVLYVPNPSEDTNRLFVVDKDGSMFPSSVYENGKVYADIFAPGKYEVTTIEGNSFRDTRDHWAQANIDYVVMRGLMSPTGDSIFTPRAAITRAEFISSLGKLSGADVSIYTKSSFSDVSDSSVHMPYIEWAVAQGIVSGIGNGMFAPDSLITREQMAVMMSNYAKALGFDLPIINPAVQYNDSAVISSWAAGSVADMQKADIMTGRDGNIFDSQGTTTRGEAASILHRFIGRIITDRRAEGFSNANSDISKRVYYTQNGVELIGWQTINGSRYYFEENGIMVTGWLEAANDRYYFQQNGKMAAGIWVEINEKSYYFYPDGRLAVNTTIDGITVGEDGSRK